MAAPFAGANRGRRGCLGLVGVKRHPPSFARFSDDATGGMMAGLRTGTFGKAIDLDRDRVGRGSLAARLLNTTAARVSDDPGRYWRQMRNERC